MQTNFETKIIYFFSFTILFWCFCFVYSFNFPLKCVKNMPSNAITFGIFVRFKNSYSWVGIPSGHCL